MFKKFILSAVLLLSSGLACGAAVHPQVTALQNAIKAKNVEQVRTIVAATLDQSVFDARVSGSFSTEYVLGVTLLHGAAVSGNAEIVQLLLDAGFKNYLEETNKAGNTALWLAAEKGYGDVVQVLAAAGADKNPFDQWGGSLLYRVAEKANVAAVQVILGLGVDVDTPDKYGRTALHIASENGHREVAQVLLRSKADLYAKKAGDGATPLHIASEYGRIEIIRELLAAGVDVDTPDNCGATALHIATEKGHTEVIEILLKAGADVNAKRIHDGTVLHIATTKGHTAMIEILLAAGADVNAKKDNGQTALHIATEKGYTEVIEILLDAGADTEIRAGVFTQKYKHLPQSRPIDLAIENNQTEIIALLEQVAKTKFQATMSLEEKKLSDALLAAFEKDDKEGVKDLLAAGADVNAKIFHGSTLLFVAALRGNAEQVKILLGAGADINLVNSSGETPFEVAYINGHKEVIAELVKAGADVNRLRDQYGHAFLLVATMCRKVDQVKILLAAGADVNLGDCNRLTPLYYASSFGYTEIVEILLAAGADSTIKHTLYDKSTPLDIACETGHNDVVAILEKAAAVPEAQRPKPLSGSLEENLEVLRERTNKKPQGSAPTLQAQKKQEPAPRENSTDENLQAFRKHTAKPTSMGRKIFRAAWITALLGSSAKGYHEFKKIKKAIIAENQEAAAKDKKVALITDNKELNKLACKELWRKHKPLVAAFAGSILGGCVDGVMPH